MQIERVYLRAIGCQKVLWSELFSKSCMIKKPGQEILSCPGFLSCPFWQ